MFYVKEFFYNFWVEVMNIVCYIYNRVIFRRGILIILYEIWKGRKLTVKYFYIFGSLCYILADRE